MAAGKGKTTKKYHSDIRAYKYITEHVAERRRVATLKRVGPLAWHWKLKLGGDHTAGDNPRGGNRA